MAIVPIQKVKRFHLTGRASHNKNFGSVTVAPVTLGRVAKYFKDQQQSNYCTAAARSTAGSYLFGEEMSFEYQTAKEGQVAGAPIFNGADPNTATTADEEYGFLKDVDSPLRFLMQGWQIPAEWQSYPASLDDEAHLNTGFASFNVYPDYQNIKQALIAGNTENSVVISNGYWYDNWQNPDSTGIIPMPQNAVTRHSYTFIDFKQINGIEYLVAQLSQGTSFGDGGLLYFSEPVLNAAFKNPNLNGLGCEIYKPGVSNPIQVEIGLLQKLIQTLGELLTVLKLKI